MAINKLACLTRNERARQQLSVGVAHQYCGALGKQANCQVLVSTTLARDEIPVALGLRLPPVSEELSGPLASR